MMPRIRAAALAASAAALMSAGCNDDSLGPSDPAGTAAGTYTLVTVNGEALPVTLPAALGSTIVIKSGTLTINTDRTYRFFNSFDDITGGSPQPDTQTCTGTWTRSGDIFLVVKEDDGNCGIGFTIRRDAENRMTMGAGTTAEMVFQR